MWTVTPRFLTAVAQPHQVVTAVTVTPPGGTVQPLGFVSGSLQVSGSQQIRRQATLVIDGGSAVFDLLSTPGARVQVSNGIEYFPEDPELVPVITGELATAAQTLGDGTIAVTVADLWQRVAATDFTTDYQPDAATGRVAEITGRVTAAVPGVTVTNLSTDSGTVGTTQTWTSRSDLIKQLATDGGLEVFFAPDGNFTIRHEAQATGTAVWTIKPGDDGNLETLERSRPLDKLYNTVIVTPASLDGAQTWTVQTVAITDTSHPRHPSKIGVRPYRWEAKSTMSAGEALSAAVILLNRTLGSTETLQLGVISNPALEAGDVVTIINVVDGGYETVNHIVDGYSLDLVTGSMTVSTRSGLEAV